jgi:hypothetical protein
MMIIVYVFLIITVCGFAVVLGLAIRDELRERSVKRAAPAAPKPKEIPAAPRVAPWCDPRQAALPPAAREEMFAHVFRPAKPLH